MALRVDFFFFLSSFDAPTARSSTCMHKRLWFLYIYILIQIPFKNELLLYFRWKLLSHSQRKRNYCARCVCVCVCCACRRPRPTNDDVFQLMDADRGWGWTIYSLQCSLACAHSAENIWVSGLDPGKVPIPCLLVCFVCFSLTLLLFGYGNYAKLTSCSWWVSMFVENIIRTW